MYFLRLFSDSSLVVHRLNKKSQNRRSFPQILGGVELNFLCMQDSSGRSTHINSKAGALFSHVLAPWPFAFLFLHKDAYMRVL